MTVRDRLELVMLGIIWGGSFLFMRIAAPEFGAFALVEVRVSIAALFLMIIILLRGRAGDMLQLAAPLTILGIVSSAVPFALFAWAAMTITAGTAAVTNATAPLFGALVGFLWLGDRLRRAQVAGLAIGFAGILILLWDRIAISVDGAPLAIVACLAAALCYGIAVNFTKQRLTGVSALVSSTGSQVVSAILLLPLAIIYWPAESPSSISWLSALALGIVCTGIAYLIYFRLIARIGPAKAITVTYLAPVFGMIWGEVFLHEPVTAGMLAACAVIVLGIALATGNYRRRIVIGEGPPSAER
jgi:drug/metabolite transporter (DMT)-like permease